MTEELRIDPAFAYHASRLVREGDALAAVRDAYNAIVAQYAARGRAPVMVELTMRVAARELSIEDDTPLVCPPNREFGETCESCQ